VIKVKPKVMPWEIGNLQVVHDQQLHNLETKSLILEI
jgi:hypothetical protein